MKESKITIKIPQDDFKMYEKYCEYLNTNYKNDITNYIQKRSEEFKNFQKINNRKNTRNRTVTNVGNDKLSTKNKVNKPKSITIHTPDMKYIYKKRNSYVVQRKIEGKDKSFGSYKTVDEAKKIRDLCEKDGWSEEIRLKLIKQR